MQYIDFHTHQNFQAGQIKICNIFAQDMRFAAPTFFYSVGLHPWHIDQVNLEECFSSIESVTGHEKMLTVGECGLDRSIKTDFALQKECFFRQIEVAEKYNKPLILHCVRAYSDLMKLKKETNSNIPWIIHGYQANLEITTRLINLGFYFSVGEKLLKNQSRLQVLRSIPLERLFLETDDSDVPIQEIYSLASQDLRIDEESLAENIFKNFKNLFGNDKLA